MSCDLSVRLGRLTLRNPVATASGTFGYGLEFAEFVDLAKLGAISVKGLSVRPCHGNPPPRICETDAGMLNAIGLQNVGVEAFLAEKLPELHRLGATVLANVWGDTEDDYVAVVERIGNDRRVAALELNVSCPNVVKGRPHLREQTAGARGAREARPRRVAAPADRQALAERHRHHGDRARRGRQRRRLLSLINTLVGLSVDIERRTPKIGFTTGGLSGPAIRPVAVRMVWEVRKALPKVPIFGIGGIESVEHVVEFLIAGANAVQIGTANFRDPSLAARLVGELAAWCDAHGVARVSDLTGTLKTRPRPEHRFG